MDSEGLTINITGSGRAGECLSLLSELLPATPAEFRERIVELAETPAQLVCLDTDSAATTGTGDLRVRLEPSDLLLELLATARTPQS